MVGYGRPDHNDLLSCESGLREYDYSGSTVTVGRFYITKLLQFRLKGKYARMGLFFV